MEPIFEYIERNIQKNGKLKKSFTLDEYKANNFNGLAFDDGAEDGLMLIYGNRRPSKRVIKEITIAINKLNDNNISQVYQELEEYFDKYEKRNIKILPSIDTVMKEILKNIKKFKITVILKLAMNILITTHSIEMMKLGLTLFQLADVSSIDSIVEVIEKIALCEEFTLYAIPPILLWENANDVIFMLAKKTMGWGKIHLVYELKPINENIKEWLITDGCANSINLGYLAKTVADKVDLITVLHRENINKNEFIGINDIMEGLLEKDNPFFRMKDMENSTELIESYLEHFKSFMNDIYFYHIPVLISKYIFYKKDKSEEEQYIFRKIGLLFESKKSINTLIKAIREGSYEDIKQAVEVASIDSNLNLKFEIFNVYKNDPFNYYFCFSYLLKFDFWKNKTIQLMENSQDFKSHYELPEPILLSSDEYYTNLLNIIQMLSVYPFVCSDIVAAGLMSKIMATRKEALNTINAWKDISKKEIKDFPKVIVEALKNLQKTEVVKSYKKIINELLGINEDLKGYVGPIVIIKENDERENINIDLFSERLDDLFKYQIISRGREYFNDNMIYSYVHYNNKYIMYVQGSKFGTEYEVEIEMNGTIIKKMKCNCPYEDNCKHEYASILYLRKKFKENE